MAQPEVFALMRLLAPTIECLYSCAIESGGSARQELAQMREAWDELAEHWSGADASEVARWMTELDAVEPINDKRSREKARARALYHLWLPLQRQLLLRLGHVWSEDGLVLTELPRPD
jgi:hypothetical protein